MFSSDHQNDYSIYLDSIYSDSFYKKIINTKAFKRLKNISFLGAIDYAIKPRSIKKEERNRHAHSLGVAVLAKYISEKRNYDKHLERHLVTAALLHDIGHAPLSHSIESMFTSKWGIGHHEVGESIINGRIEKISDIKKILDSKLDKDFLITLIDGQYKGEGGDLFSNKINIDTIDGIIRASKYISKGPQKLTPFDVANAAFIDINQTICLDNFWELKDNIYKNFIINNIGLKADKISQQYFELREYDFDESDFTSHEQTWKKKHSLLFEMLSTLNTFSNLDGSEIDIVKRHYSINKSFIGNDRYICKKENIKFKFADKKIQEETQYELTLEYGNWK